jgi:hypothetical protein
LNKHPSVLYTLVVIRHSLAANSLFIEDNVKGFRALDLISRLRRITEGATGGRWILSTLIHSHQINRLRVYSGNCHMTDLVPTIVVKQNRGSRITATATVLRVDLLIGHAPPLMQRQSVADHLPALLTNSERIGLARLGTRLGLRDHRRSAPIHFRPFHPFNFSNQPSFHPPLTFLHSHYLYLYTQCLLEELDGVDV